jgi:hypothetical protein
MNKEKKRWKWIVYFDSLLQVCLGSSLAQGGRRVRTTLDLPIFASLKGRVNPHAAIIGMSRSHKLDRIE